MYWTYNRTSKVSPLTGKPYVEYCSKNKEKKRGSLREPTSVAGNGTFGFLARKPSEGIEQVKYGDDELYNKHRRKTACKPRKNVCRMATTWECHRPDRLIENERRLAKKAGQKRFRARKGQKPRN